MCPESMASRQVLAAGPAHAKPTDCQHPNHQDSARLLFLQVPSSLATPPPTPPPQFVCKNKYVPVSIGLMEYVPKVLLWLLSDGVGVPRVQQSPTALP